MENVNVKPGLLFWILGVVFVLWNLMGCGFYLMDVMMSEAAYAETYGAEMAEAYKLYPVWAVAAYAIAVWGGLLASLLFLLRKRLCIALFAISLVASIICFVPNFTNDVLRDAGGASFWIMPLIVVVLGVFEVWFSRLQRAKGILR